MIDPGTSQRIDDLSRKRIYTLPAVAQNESEDPSPNMVGQSPIKYNVNSFQYINFDDIINLCYDISPNAPNFVIMTQYI